MHFYSKRQDSNLQLLRFWALPWCSSFTEQILHKLITTQHLVGIFIYQQSSKLWEDMAEIKDCLKQYSFFFFFSLSITQIII